MIVVIGSPSGRSVDGAMTAGGMSSRVALAAVRSGGAVQLVGKVGDDPTSDAVILDLARGGVGHVALLREAARETPLEPPADDEAEVRPDADEPTGPDTEDSAATPDPPALDAADVDLGLRYLTDFGVVVLAEASRPDVVAVVAEAARWGESRMVLVVAAGSTVPDGLPADAIVFEAPDGDPDGVFADLVGAFAAALDDGVDPSEAFRASIETDGWTEATAD